MGAVQPWTSSGVSARRMTVKADAACGPTLHRWRRARRPGKALIVHGWGTHGRTCAPLGEALARANIEACAIDLPGHGAAAGERFSFSRVEEAPAAAVRLIPRHR